MPQEDYYVGRSLKEQLRRFAEHHYRYETRHISQYEYGMLLKVLELLPDDEAPSERFAAGGTS